MIATATTDLVKKEDLATLQKLEEDFVTEIATLRQRVHTLEAKTATLEAQQFSTTAKLTGQAWMNLTGAFTSSNVKYESIPGATAANRFIAARDAAGSPLVQQTDEAQPTLSGLTSLTFNSSFTGKDNLVVQLAAGNGISPTNEFLSAGFFNTIGVPYTDQTSGTVNGVTDVVVQDLFYSFPLSDSLKVTVGPRINWFTYFDGNRFTYFLTGAVFYSNPRIIYKIHTL